MVLCILLSACSGDQRRNAALLPAAGELPQETKTQNLQADRTSAEPSQTAASVPLITITEESSGPVEGAADTSQSLAEAAVFIERPRLVREEDFESEENLGRWISEFPLNTNGSRIVNGELVLDSPDSEWRMAGLLDPIQSFLDEAGISASAAVLIHFHYSGSSNFRFQVSIRPEGRPDYLYETGIQFDEFPQRFIQAPDENPDPEKMFGWLQVKENEAFSLLMGINREKGEFTAAIWQPGDPENSLVYYSDLGEGLPDEPWRLVLYTYKDTRISISEVQILAFGE